MRSLLPRLRQPSRYTGIEQGAVHKDPSAVTVRAALCFPDLYEVGMSHLGQKIIYGIINRHLSWWAERCYEPDREDCDILRETGTRLATLESDTDLKDMNLVGFSITHELCYPDVLNMLDLGGIPLHTSERPQDLKACPLVIAGGGALLSAEPMAPFLDLMILGDGEETMVDLLNALEKALQGVPHAPIFCARPAPYRASTYPLSTGKAVTAAWNLSFLKPPIPQDAWWLILTASSIPRIRSSPSPRYTTGFPWKSPAAARASAASVTPEWYTGRPVSGAWRQSRNF